MRLEQAERQMRRVCERIKRGVQRAEDKSAKRGVQIAKYYSSGHLGKAIYKLRPFARQRGHKLKSFLGAQSPALADVGTINVISGTFRRSWGIKYSNKFGDPIPVIYNRAPYAKFLQTGTKYMLARPVDERIKAALMPIRMINLRYELAQQEINLK